MSLQLPFPRGIINIISDYAHTLFYIEELKDKTEEIYDRIEGYRKPDLSYYYTCIVFYENRFIISRGIGTNFGWLRYKLFDKENIRRVSFGMKKNYNMWVEGYNKNYQSY